MVKEKANVKEKAMVKAMGKILAKAKAKDMEKSIKTTEKDIKEKARAIKERVGSRIVVPHGGAEPLQPQHIQRIGNGSPIGKEEVKPKAKNTEGHPLSVSKIVTNVYLGRQDHVKKGESCNYWHNPDCKSFQKGQCPYGKSCKWRHLPIGSVAKDAGGNIEQPKPQHNG